MKQWHKLTSIDRTESDKKYAEVEDILKQIETLQKNRLEVNNL